MGKRNYGYSYTYRPEIRVKTGTKTYSDIAFVKDGKYRDGSDKLAIKEVNRTSTSLPLTAMHKEIAWLFRCHPIVIHDFRPLSHTDFYHIVHRRA